MKKKQVNYILNTLVFLSVILLAARLSGPAFLRVYVESGIGDCKKIPIFCMAPSEEISNAKKNDEFISQLRPYRFPKIEIFLPKGFAVIQERIRKDYYKKRKGANNTAQVYLLHEEKDFFINLYPQLKNQGVNDNYEFIKRIMYANEKKIENLTDVFFVVMKGIFTPDIGEQKTAVMASFNMEAFRGFINYNISGPDHYFDCNIVNNEGGYFKVYIKDIGASLDLGQVLSIITTIRETGH